MKLALTSVAYTYGPRAALADISLAAEGGEFVGVIGPNGSGKSTLLKIAAGLAAPSAGSCTLDGTAVTAYAPRERAKRIAWCPQEAFFTFPFRSLDVVLMARAPHLGMWGLTGDADRQAALSAMALMDAAHLADRPIDELSGGERRRVMLARTVAQGAGVVLLDEPTAGLDIGHSVRVLGAFRDLARAGRLVVASLHDINEAAAYCDRVVMLREGRMAASGTVAQVLTWRNVRDTFGVDVYAGVNEITGARFLVPFV